MKKLSSALLPLLILPLVGCGAGTAIKVDVKTSSSASSLISSSMAVSSISPVSSLASSADTSSVASSGQISSSSSDSPHDFTALPVSEFIVVDQFGYLPDVKKIAIVRDPQAGFDSQKSFTPGASYRLVDINTGEAVANLAPTLWKAGDIATVSGDKVWWLDFSSTTSEGRYALVDIEKQVRSPSFSIAQNVYKPVLRDAVRYFFYQRAGFAKQTPFADAKWTDTASHLGACQDKNARLFTDQSNASTERDLSGGWYDAGDYNKYTNWHADYLIALMSSYLENPSVWTDDFNIPESGNGIPDLIDEIKWGMDWLVKMQESNGSVLSIVGLSHEKANGEIASPPSTATGCSYYGPASTSATLGAAAAFALGSKLLRQFDEFSSYATNLSSRAENAWTWANNNPLVVVNNNQGIYAGLGAGNQEVDAPARDLKKIRAAIYLYGLTNDAHYHSIVTSSFGNTGYWIDMWEEERTYLPWLYYANLPTANTTVATELKSRYNSTMNGALGFAQINNKDDAYRAHLGTGNFTWGSNRSMARIGNTFMNLLTYNVGSHNTDATAVKNAATGYLNYLHGTNPLGTVYLSNMYHLGVHQSVDEFYHSWFTDGSTRWDNVNTSTYGPAPGFLVGGPNPTFEIDSCCTTGPNFCWDKTNMCSVELIPPKSQPPMKSYASFNTSWPLNSWQVSENHNDYQVAYIRLLARLAQN